MGLVRITYASWYPNFNGNHFGLPPSEIHRMTELGGEIVWTMTYSHRPNYTLNERWSEMRNTTEPSKEKQIKQEHFTQRLLCAFFSNCSFLLCSSFLVSVLFPISSSSAHQRILTHPKHVNNHNVLCFIQAVQLGSQIWNLDMLARNAKLTLPGTNNACVDW